LVPLLVWAGLLGCVPYSLVLAFHLCVDAKEAEESRIARQKLGKSALKVLGVLVIIGAIIGLIVAAIYGLSQVPWGDLLPKSPPANTTSSSSSKSFLSGALGQLLGLVMLLAIFVGMFNAVKT
jgi:hypothetical protein